MPCLPHWRAKPLDGMADWLSFIQARPAQHKQLSPPWVGGLLASLCHLVAYLGIWVVSEAAAL